MKFAIKVFLQWIKGFLLQKTADLFILTGEILIGNFIFCAVSFLTRSSSSSCQRNFFCHSMHSNIIFNILRGNYNIQALLNIAARNQFSSNELVSSERKYVLVQTLSASLASGYRTHSVRTQNSGIKTFRRCSWDPLNALCTFSLLLVSRR